MRIDCAPTVPLSHHQSSSIATMRRQKMLPLPLHQSDAGRGYLMLDPVHVVMGEIQNVLAAMRLNRRWTASMVCLAHQLKCDLTFHTTLRHVGIYLYYTHTLL